MKKVIIIVMCILIIGGSVGAIFYLKSRPPKPVYYGFKDTLISDIRDSKKHLVFSPTLKIRKKGKEKYLDEHARIIRNVILFVVREKTEAELTDTDDIEALSGEIIFRLSEQMDVSFIEEVFFDQYYIG